MTCRSMLLVFLSVWLWGLFGVTLPNEASATHMPGKWVFLVITMHGGKLGVTPMWNEDGDERGCEVSLNDTQIEIERHKGYFRLKGGQLEKVVDVTVCFFVPREDQA